MKYEIFNKHTKEYEEWYERNWNVYQSELLAIKPHITKGISLEIGVGSGRFAEPLKIDFGLDPSIEMLKLAKKRDVKVLIGISEKMPFKKESFDFILMVVTICFLEDPEKALFEAKRILKTQGKIIIGFVDKDSFLGKIYLAKKEKSIFYKEAKFYSTSEIINFLEITGFKPVLFTQTIFKPLQEIIVPEPVKEGYGEGAFIVISAKKN